MSDSPGPLGIIAWLLFFGLRAIARINPSSGSDPWRPSTSGPASGRPHGYAVPCPLCGRRDLKEARQLEVLGGIGLWPTVEVHTISGCRECVRREGWRLIGMNLRRDWKTVGGLLATPYMLARTLRRTYVRASPELADRLVREAGLDPEQVRLNRRGITIGQERMVVAAATVFAPLVWADGPLSLPVQQRAIRAMRRLTHDRLSEESAKSSLEMGRFDLMDVGRQSHALRATLFRMLREVAIAAGTLSSRRLQAVYFAGGWLGYSPKEVQVLLGSFAWAPPDPTADDPRARQHRHGHGGQRQDYQQSYRGGYRRTYTPPPIENDVALARTILGVSATASYAEIQAAYRVLISRSHPDRAGSDPKVQTERTRRTQELTWAMGTLRKAMAKGVS